jgi:hypothetical protein
MKRTKHLILTLALTVVALTATSCEMLEGLDNGEEGGGGTPSGISFTSVDGLSSVFSTGVTGVTFGDGLFVAVGGQVSSGEETYATAAWSTDGITWTPTGLGSPMTPFDVASGGGGYVAVGWYGAFPITDFNPNYSNVSYSSDGKGWRNFEVGMMDDQHLAFANFEAVAYGNGTFVAVGEGPFPGSMYGLSPGPCVYYSTDGGASWTRADDGWFKGWMSAEGIEQIGIPGASGSLLDITHDGTKFYAVGSVNDMRDVISAKNYGVILSSPDGIEWEIVFKEDEELASDVDKFTAIASGNGTYIAGTHSYHLYRSDSGTGWTRANRTAITGDINNSSLFGAPITDITFGAGRFMAVSAYGEIGFSTDGAAWSKVNPNPFHPESYTGYEIGGAAFGAGRFVAVGGDDSYTARPIIAYSDEQQ